MGKFCDVMHGLKPLSMMVTSQIALAGATLLYKIAGNYGMSFQVLIAYRFMFAAATVVPLALIIERKNRPRLTWKIMLQAFVSALFGGSMAQNLYAESLVLTSATFAAAIVNLTPALTFLLAIVFRMERLGLKTKPGKAKLTGTFICISGAMILTFYRGCEVNIWSTNLDLLSKTRHQYGGHVSAAHHHKSALNKILGLLLALACCLGVSISLIVQAKMSEIYPCHYSSTALITVMGSFQAILIALCVERDWKQWKLGWNLTLLAASYMGIVASGIVWVLMMSCVRMRGPLYVSVFNPLMLVLVGLLGSLLVNEKLHLGSVVGAAIIICGLYSVLWGKNKEMKRITQLVSSTTQPHGNTEATPESLMKSEIVLLEKGCPKEEEQDIEAKIIPTIMP